MHLFLLIYAICKKQPEYLVTTDGDKYLFLSSKVFSNESSDVYYRVVKCKSVGGSYTAVCPYCGCEHTHGDAFGKRAIHCSVALENTAYVVANDSEYSQLLAIAKHI